MKWRWIALLVPLLSGCATLFESTDKPKSQIIATRRWARSTVDRTFLESRRMHRMAPILTDQWVIQGNAIDGIAAYSRRSARQIWKFHVRGGIEGGAQLVGKTLYFAAGDGFFYALDATNGEIKWTFPIHFEGLGEPLVEDKIVYFLAGNNVAYALDAETGHQIWLYNRRDPSTLSIRGGARPTVVGRFVYFGFSDGYLVALDKAQGRIEWETNINQNKRFRDVDSGPIIDDGKLFVTSYDGGLYCVNPETGQIFWSINDGGFSSPLVLADRVIYSTANGKVVAVQKSTGNLIWSRNLAKITARPTQLKGAVVVGEFEGNLVLLNAKNGDTVAQFAPGRGVTSPATVDEAKNEIYFISADANLFSLKLKKLAQQILDPENLSL